MNFKYVPNARIAEIAARDAAETRVVISEISVGEKVASIHVLQSQNKIFRVRKQGGPLLQAVLIPFPPARCQELSGQFRLEAGPDRPAGHPACNRIGGHIPRDEGGRANDRTHADPDACAYFYALADPDIGTDDRLRKFVRVIVPGPEEAGQGLRIVVENRICAHHRGRVIGETDRDSAGDGAKWPDDAIIEG